MRNIKYQINNNIGQKLFLSEYLVLHSVYILSAII